MNTHPKPAGRKTVIILLAMCLPLVLNACAPALAGVSPTQGSSVSAAATVQPSAPVTSPASLPAWAQAWVLAGAGNQASYRVREQLANRSLPSDAVGSTTNVSGKLAIGADGQPIASASLFSVDLTSLRSDAGGRDRYVRQNSLQTDSFPSAEFTPKTVQGLPSPLPTSGKVTFQLIGALTVHGVTKPATWDVTAEVNGLELTGAATTTFTFSDFGLQVPRVFVVLSVEDKIQLEYDFHLVPAPSGI